MLELVSTSRFDLAIRAADLSYRPSSYTAQFGADIFGGYDEHVVRATHCSLLREVLSLSAHHQL